MRSDTTQRDLLRDCDPELARANREAAATAAVDPHFYGRVREARVRYYLQQARYHETGERD